MPPRRARTKAGGVDPRVRAFIRRGGKKKKAPVYGRDYLGERERLRHRADKSKSFSFSFFPLSSAPLHRDRGHL